ncbi:MAG: tetratricopeptide repeat protein [Planctomycetes bacterium]|nr:tetratricopeptide repeat protein [Planctomycetota bacterium]
MPHAPNREARLTLRVLLLGLAAFPAAGEEVSVRTPQEEADLQLKMANELYAGELHSLASDAYKRFFSLKASLIHARRDEALYRYGESLIRLEKFNDAVNPFDQLIRNHPESRFTNNALFRRGTLRFLLNDPKMAIPDLVDLLQRLQAETPQGDAAAGAPALQVPAKYYLGRAYRTMGDLDRARPLLEAVEKEKASEYRREALFHLADLDFTRQKWELAQAEYEAYRNEYPQAEEIPLTNLRLGLVYRELGNFEKAIEALRRIPAGGAYSDLALYLEVASFFQSQAHAEVLKSFSRLEQLHAESDAYRNSDDYASALYMAGVSHYTLEHYPEAVSTFENMAKRFEKHAELESARWMTCMSYYYLQNFEGMVRSASAFLAQFPPESRFLQDVHYVYAEGLLGLQKHADALSYFQKVPPESAFHLPACYRIPLCHLKLAQEAAGAEEKVEFEKRAAAAFDSFAAKFPNDKNARKAILRSAELNQGFKDFPRAEQRYLEFLVTYAKDAGPEETEHARFSLGQCQLAQGKLEAMAVSFVELLKEFPQTAHSTYAHYWIGRHYEDRKEWERAIPFYEKAVKDVNHELSDDAIRRQALCFYEAKKFDAAAETIFEIYKTRPKVSFPDDVAVWVADQFTAQDRRPDSIWVYQHLLQGSPEGKWRDRCIYKIHEQYFDLKDWDKTIQWGNRFMESAASNAQKNEGLEAVRFQTAYAYHQLKDYANAEPLYHRLRQEGAGPDLLTRTELELGKLYHEKGEHEKALMEYLVRVGVLSQQHGAEAKYYAGLCLWEMSKKSDIQRALENLDNLVKLWKGAGQRKGLIQDFPDSPFTAKAQALLPEIEQKLEELRKQAGP